MADWSLTLPVHDQCGSQLGVVYGRHARVDRPTFPGTTSTSVTWLALASKCDDRQADVARPRDSVPNVQFSHSVADVRNTVTKDALRAAPSAAHLVIPLVPPGELPKAVLQGDALHHA